MKAIINKLVLLTMGILLVASCNSDEAKVTYLGATAPGVVLTASTTSNIILKKANAVSIVIQFNWTNPNYQFSNGPSTQDVSYALQIDTTGSNFTNPNMGIVTFTNTITDAFTVKQLNTALNGLQLKFAVFHPFEFRVKATLANNNEPVYSNVVKIKIATYLDVVYPVPANLYITGSASPNGWMSGGDPVPTSPSPKFTLVNPYTFVLSNFPLIGGQQFLLVPVYGDWTHKYASTITNSNPAGDFFVPDASNNFIGPAASGNYTITVNFATGKFTIQ